MRFDGGRVCLDLAAMGAVETADPPPGRPRGERLAQWLYGAGLVPPATAVPVAPDWPQRFAALGALLRRLVAAEVDGAAAAGEDIAALNGFARPSPPAPAAVPGREADSADAAEREHGSGLRKQLAAPPSCESLLSAVARDAVDLLTDPVARARLRRCEGERCTRVYLDTSRGRRRRWCSSEVCGNRERVARHRRRSTLSATQG